MKKTEITNLQDKNAAELTKILTDLRSEIGKTSLDFNTGKIKNTNLIKNLRRKIAVAATILRGKELFKNG